MIEIPLPDRDSVLLDPAANDNPRPSTNPRTACRANTSRHNTHGLAHYRAERPRSIIADIKPKIWEAEEQYRRTYPSGCRQIAQNRLMPFAVQREVGPATSGNLRRCLCNQIIRQPCCQSPAKSNHPIIMVHKDMDNTKTIYWYYPPIC